MSKLYAHGRLLLQFLQREIRSRYLGSVSGFFWVFIQPIAQLAIYGFVFSVIFKIRFPELEQHGFLIFVALALWPWLAFAEALQRASLSIQNNAGLIKKVRLPNEVLVVSSVGASYAVHGVGFLLVLFVLRLSGVSLDLTVLPLLVLLLLLQMVFTLGLGFLVAAFQVFLRDLEHVLVPVVMLWFYATPVLYPRSLVPEAYQPLIDANPMTYFIDRIRSLLMYQDWSVGWMDLFAVLATLALCYAGWRVFRRCSRRFEDFL